MLKLRPLEAVALLVLVIGCSLGVHAVVYHVAEDVLDCPDNVTCHELSFYTNQPDLYFTNNTIFYFLEGNHILRQQKLVVIRGVSNLTLQGEGVVEQGFSETVMQSTAVVSCLNGSGGLLFFQCQNTMLSSLTFTNCGGRITGDVQQYIINTSSIWEEPDNSISYTLVFYNGIDFTISELSIQNGTGYGLTTFNTFNVRLSNSSFSRNNQNSYQTGDCSFECFGGNALFLYFDTYDCLAADGMNYFLDISNSNFSHGVDRVSNLIIGSGLGINVITSTNYKVTVSVRSVILHDNLARYGANLFLRIAANTALSSISVSGTKSYNGNSTIGGGGLYYSNSIYNIPPCMTNLSGTNELLLEGSHFHNNNAKEGAGVWIGIYPQADLIKKTIAIDSCSFFNNTGEVGSGLHAFQYSLLADTSATNILIDNSTFENNFHLQFAHEGNSAVNLLALRNITLTGVKVCNHQATGIHLYSSTLIIHGEKTIIQNNRGHSGGGIYLGGNSHIILRSPANLSLIDNTAEKGGAIFVQETPTSDITLACFFQVADPSSITNPFNSPDPNVSVYTSGNTAKVTGDLLYGSDIDRCGLVIPSKYYFFNYSRSVFEAVFDYHQNDEYRLVSSDASQVCFCDDWGVPDCEATGKNISASPGMKFQFSVATVGLFWGFSPGSIKSVTYSSDRLVQEVLFWSSEANCSNMTFSVAFDAAEASIELTVRDFDRYYPPRVINITIESCPPGFSVSNQTGVCECSPAITAKIRNATCNISTMEITREGANWIAYDFNDNCVIARKGCPFFYCTDERVTFTLNDTHLQCAMNRSGVLCGRCEHGLSLILGSNNCRVCSNAFLTLLLPFALLGFLLVAFLIAFNLTVAVGTINGLIFYANIVKINEPFFFPSGPHNFIPILSQFISWFNLDFGFQTCFYNGMDAYAKTWLQFVFPLYIWLLVIVIIVISPYSRLVSRLAGSNAVPVLATLFLLSYTKVLRTAIQALQISYINCGESLRRVWAVDGNVDYFSGPHLALFIFALLVILFVAFPYTVLVLLNPIFESHLTNFSRFKWLSRLKPYYDAYSGPYRDRYRFWPGLLLLARLVLALVIPFSDDNTNLSFIITIVILLMVTAWNLRGVYNRWYLDMLESWFLFNTALYCTFAFIGHADVGGKVTISLVFVTFHGILLFHTYKRLRKTSYWQRLTNSCFESKCKIIKSLRQKLSHEKLLSKTEKAYVENDLITSTTVVLRRESLLDDDVNSKRYSVIEI